MRETLCALPKTPARDYIRIISSSVLQMAFFYFLISSVILLMHKRIHFFLCSHCGTGSPYRAGQGGEFPVCLSRPRQGTVPRAVTQLWRPPAVWVPPPSGSLPVTRTEGQNRIEWARRINSSEPGQGQRQKEKAFVYKRSGPYRRGSKQQRGFLSAGS